MAELTEAQKLQQAKLRKEALEGEADARAKRIQMRQDRREVANFDSEKKKTKRMFRLAGIWVVLIIAAFFAAIWFSADIVSWVHDTLN